MERYAVLASLEAKTIVQAQMLFHRVRVCAAHLHSPPLVGIVCLMIVDTQLRSDIDKHVKPEEFMWTQTLEARDGGCDISSSSAQR